MRLIGMLDSPYVRRVAVSLKLMGIAFDHEPVSVFRHYETFHGVNPVVKAPTLVTDDGVVLMESSLILEHLETLVPAGASLAAKGGDHALAQRIVGLALIACEKTVSLVYEFTLRPPEKQHGPWIERVRNQLLQAYGLLEAEVAARPQWMFGDRPTQADVTAAVAWRFTEFAQPGEVDPAAFPALVRLSKAAEAHPAFASTPLD